MKHVTRCLLLMSLVFCEAYAEAADQGTPNVAPTARAELLQLHNGTVKIGIDRNKGASISWLSWADYPKNAINIADPGRLIQQSYYAGHNLDRTAEGQHKAWSPWTWNPIQGGGVGSWARVTEFKQLNENTLFGETIPKLWDMPDEDAEALMRQWTGFEPGMSNVVVVRCEFISQREENDRWGPAAVRPQEVPACYFTRNFDGFKSYLGDGQWREESQPPGPPWGRAQPPRKAMAAFAPSGQGIAIFSPSSTVEHWNFGPHGDGASDDPTAGPCVHIAPLSRVKMGPRSTYRYRYWLVVGTEIEITQRLDKLWDRYSAEHAELIESKPEPGSVKLQGTR